MDTKVPGQQLFAAVHHGSHLVDRTGMFIQEARLELQPAASVLNKWPQSSHDALIAAPEAKVSSLQEVLSNIARGRNTTAVSKWTTAEDALQWLTTEMNNNVIQFVQSCKEVSDCVNDSLQKSSNRIKACLKRFDRADLHLLAEIEMTQVCAGLHEELEHRKLEIQRMSTHVQTSWECLCNQSSVCLVEVAAHLHSTAHMPIESVQSALSSHSLHFNLAALADKRAADAVVTCLTTVNMKVEKQVRQESTRTADNWRQLVTDYEIHKLVNAISQPRFMRHADFVSKLSGIIHTQKALATRVLESMITSMLLPSAVHTVETAQQAFCVTQEVCNKWQLEIRRAMDELVEQYESQTQFCRSFCMSVQAQCTKYAGYPTAVLSGLFNDKCFACFENARLKEKCLVQRICTEVEAEHRKWVQMVNTCFHNLTSRCANELHQHKCDCETELAMLQASLSDLQAKQQAEVEVQEHQYQKLLDKISFSSTEDQVENLRLEALQHLAKMKQGYQSSHHILLQFLTVQELRLKSMYEMHSNRICDVLGIARESVLQDTGALVAKANPSDDGGLPVGLKLMESTGNGDGHSDGSHAVFQSVDQLLDHPIYGTRYIRTCDLVTKLLAMPLAFYESTRTEVIHEPTTPTCTVAVPGGLADPAGTVGGDGCSVAHETFRGMLKTKEQAMLSDIQMPLPAAALKTHIGSFIHHVMEHVIKHQIQASASAELWKAQAASYGTARLDQLLQHHRPRMGVLEEDWCSKRRLALKGVDNTLTKFLCKQSSFIALQVEEFDRRVSSATTASQNMVARVKDIGMEFQHSCSIRAVKISERKLEAKVEEIKNKTGNMFDRIRGAADQELEEIIAQCSRFLGDSPASVGPSIVPDGAANAHRKIQSLSLCVADVRQKQHSLVEVAKAASIAAVYEASEALKSKLSTFIRDAAFVEITKKIKDDMDRDFNSALDSSENTRAEIQNLIQKLQGLITRLRNQHGQRQEVAESHNSLLMTAERLRRSFLRRSQELQVLDIPNPEPQPYTALVLLSSVDQILHTSNEQKTSPAMEHDKTVDGESKPLQSRICGLLEGSLQSFELAASDYFAPTNCGVSSHRSDIPADKTLFMSHKCQLYQALSAQFDHHIAHEQAMLRMQVLEAYKAIHALPETICKAHVSYGVDGVRQQAEQVHQVYQKQMKMLESQRLLHQKELPDLLQVDCKAQLEDLIQRETARQSQVAKLCNDTSTSLISSLKTRMEEVLQRMAQMCFALSAFLRCWVSPRDLSGHGSTNAESCEEASPFEYLSLLESVIDGSKVEKAGTNPGRNVCNMTWQAFIPTITTKTLIDVAPNANVNGTTIIQENEQEVTKIQSVSVFSLDTPVHWLLMWAHEQATNHFIEQSRSCVATTISRIDWVIRHEHTWQDNWTQMLSDVQTKKLFA